MIELEAKQGKRANAVRTDKFVCVQTYSGRGLLGRDSQGSTHVLSPDVDDVTLGTAMLDALGKSRFLSADEARELLNQDRAKPEYEAWVQDVLGRYGYKSRRALFKDMVCCNVKLIGDVISMGPTSHPKLEGWEGLAEDQSVVVQGHSAPAKIGAALRLAFGRCET